MAQDCMLDGYVSEFDVSMSKNILNYHNIYAFSTCKFLLTVNAFAWITHDFSFFFFSTFTSTLSCWFGNNV